jgi:hypothetical protein
MNKDVIDFWKSINNAWFSTVEMILFKQQRSMEDLHAFNKEMLNQMAEIKIDRKTK